MGGIGGILGGLGQVSTAVQNGQLQGQIQGKELQFNQQIQLANLMREAQQAQAENEYRQSQADYFQNRLPAMLQQQAMKGGTAEEIAAGQEANRKAIADQAAQLRSQYQDIIDRQNRATDTLKQQFYGLQAEQLKQRLDQVERANGMAQIGHFITSTADDRKTLAPYTAFQGSLSQIDKNNPAAVRGLLTQLAQNEMGGGSARLQLVQYLAKVNNGVVPNTAQQASLLIQNKLPDSDVLNIANQIEGQHQAFRQAYDQKFQPLQRSIATTAPEALPMLDPYSTEAQFDIGGSTKGSTGASLIGGGNARANPFPAPAPAAPPPPPTGSPLLSSATPGLGFSPTAGITAPAVPPPRQLLQSGAPTPTSTTGTSN